MSRRRGEAFGNDYDFKNKNICPKFPDMECEWPECRRVQATVRELERLKEEEKRKKLSKQATKIQKAFRKYRDKKLMAEWPDDIKGIMS